MRSAEHATLETRYLRPSPSTSLQQRLVIKNTGWLFPILQLSRARKVRPNTLQRNAIHCRGLVQLELLYGIQKGDMSPHFHWNPVSSYYLKTQPLFARFKNEKGWQSTYNYSEISKSKLRNFEISSPNFPSISD